MRKLLHVNRRHMTLYYSDGISILQNEDEFNKLISQKKKEIKDRDYILHRFEPWEVNSVEELEILLHKRARNEEEKRLVISYFSYIRRK